MLNRTFIMYVIIMNIRARYAEWFLITDLIRFKPIINVRHLDQHFLYSCCMHETIMPYANKCDYIFSNEYILGQSSLIFSFSDLSRDQFEQSVGRKWKNKKKSRTVK